MLQKRKSRRSSSPRPIGTLDGLAAQMRRTGSPMAKMFVTGKVPVYVVGTLALLSKGR